MLRCFRNCASRSVVLFRLNEVASLVCGPQSFPQKTQRRPLQAFVDIFERDPFAPKRLHTQHAILRDLPIKFINELQLSKIQLEYITGKLVESSRREKRED